MKPILFNTEMVTAILDGKKTQTRRIIKGNPRVDEVGHWLCDGINWGVGFGGKPYLFNFIKWEAKYKVGDILWVREPAKIVSFTNDGNYGGSHIEAHAIVKYLADDKEVFWDEFPENAKSWLWECKGIPNGCCKSLARIFLRATNVRVERLQDIDYNDILQEGYIKNNCYSPEEWFKKIWDSTAKEGYKWEDNPYVFVYEFERINYAK